MQTESTGRWLRLLRHRVFPVSAGGYVGWFCAAFVAAHGLATLTLGVHAKLVSFLFLTAAPLMSAAACVLRGRRDRTLQGWTELALAMLLWAVGMASYMAAECLLRKPGSEPGISMLLYILYGVPLIFAVASPAHEKWYIRSVDGVLALTLGIVFFGHVFAFATLDHSTQGEPGGLRYMFDVENGFITGFALVRWRACIDPARRAFFRILALFAWVYLAAAAFINHVAFNVDFGTGFDVTIDLPFLLLVVLALDAGSTMARTHHLPPRRFALAVRAGSPLMLPVTILVVACVWLSLAPDFAVLGLVVATLGYGLRNILAQMRGIAEQDRLDALSRIDALTGLPNRRQFDETLHREWARARRVGGSIAVLVIDIDHFKRLNDGLGHLVGDERLRDVGQELASCALRGSDFVCRFGGEEFVVILPGASEGAAEALAENMREAVAARSLPTPAPFGIVTVSIGLAWQERVDTGDPAPLVAAADRALYQAKQEGRNRVRRHSVVDVRPMGSGRVVCA